MYKFAYPRAIAIASSLIGCFSCCDLGLAQDSANWPRFRGPGARGVSDSVALPDRFLPETNMRWKTALPPGHSSPVVWGDRVFLTGVADDQLQTLCLQLGDGKILWTRNSPLRNGKVPKVRNVNSPASPTPVVNADAVFVYFDAFGILAYDHDGNERWRKPLPKSKQPWGVGTSPVLAGDRVLLNVDQDIDSYLLALDTGSGETVWRIERPEFRRAFSTPAVTQDQVIVAGTLRLVAYDLDDGHECWTVHGLPYQVSASPVWADDRIYLAAWDAGGVMDTFDGHLKNFDKDGDDMLTSNEHNFAWDFPKYDRNKDKRVTRQEFEDLKQVYTSSRNRLFAVRTDGAGNVTDTHVEWEALRSLPHIPTVLVYRDLVYTVRNGGIVSCYDAKTGKQHYQSRLPAPGDYYASPVAGNGNIYFSSSKGVVCVIRASTKFELVSKSDFEAPIFATPAIVSDTVLIRSGKHLYSFGE